VVVVGGRLVPDIGSVLRQEQDLCPGIVSRKVVWHLVLGVVSIIMITAREEIGAVPTVTRVGV
jgi:hypothetical protein